MTSGQGGLLGVSARGSPYSRASRDNQSQRARSSKNSPNFSKGNQEKPRRNFFHGNSGGSQSGNYHNWKCSMRNRSDRDLQSLSQDDGVVVFISHMHLRLREAFGEIATPVDNVVIQ